MIVFVSACRITEPTPVTAVPGLIWSVEEDRGIKPADLEHRLLRADVVMIGEVHDNPRHHVIEAELIRRLTTTRQLQVVALEMLDREQQKAVASVWPAGRAEQVLEAAAFDERGWGAARYRPVIEAMLDAEVQPLAANLSREEAGQIVREGGSALFDAERRQALALDAVWNDALEARLIASLRESHCGMLPESMLPGMLAAQRARDAVLADRVLSRVEDGVILVAGGEHIRRDYGVPAYLAERAPSRAVATILLMEVDGARPVSEYLAEWPGSKNGPLFDYVWFTQTTERGDPCAIFESREALAPPAQD